MNVIEKEFNFYKFDEIEEIEDWLSDYDVTDFSIDDETLEVTINETFNLYDYTDEYLPIKINEIDGNFIIQNATDLKSLIGFPNKISGSLQLRNCSRITDLQYVGEFTGKWSEIEIYNCDNFISLAGIENFDKTLKIEHCDSLDTLEDCPQKIENLTITGCKNLNSLSGSPKEILILSLYDTYIKNLKNAPSINAVINIFGGTIKNLKGLKINDSRVLYSLFENTNYLSWLDISFNFPDSTNIRFNLKDDDFKYYEFLKFGKLDKDWWDEVNKKHKSLKFDVESPTYRKLHTIINDINNEMSENFIGNKMKNTDFTKENIIAEVLFGNKTADNNLTYKTCKLDEIKFDGSYRMIDSIQGAMDSKNYFELLTSCNKFLEDLQILQNGKIKMSMTKKDVLLTDLIMSVVRLRSEIMSFITEHDKTTDSFKNMTDIFKLMKFYLYKIKNEKVAKIVENIITIREEIRNLKIKLE
jgi:hypothetical protein